MTKRTADEVIVKYLDLCSDLCREPEDYTQKNVRKHNKSFKNLLSLAQDVSEKDDLAKIVFYTLLENEDIYIRQVVATHCLKFGYYAKKAEKILEAAAKEKGLSGFNAQMTLKVYRGHISGKTL